MTLDAVLVSLDGLEQRWCEKQLEFGGCVYAYRDVVLNKLYPPHRCREIKTGTVEVRAVEVEPA